MGLSINGEVFTVWLERLVQLKKNSGMTIEQIATASGVPKGTLNKLFAGQTKDPQLSTVSAVVHCMGYTLDDLSGDTSNGETVLTPRQSALLSSFDQLNEEGQTILMVTHSAQAASHASRVLFIKDGEVFHQIYKGSKSRQEMYQMIADTLTILTTGGEQHA